MKELLASLILSFFIADTAQGIVHHYKHNLAPKLVLNNHLSTLENDLE